jgi:RHS repeat-associated protein
MKDMSAKNKSKSEQAENMAIETKKLALIVKFLVFLILLSTPTNGQSDQTNVRFAQGSADDQGALSLSIPFGQYKGRGIDLPIALNYSSQVWQIDHLGTHHVFSGAVSQSVTEAIYAEHSASGWKSNLDLPMIEFPKWTTAYDYKGKAMSYPAGGCYGYRIAEVYIHMPDGSVHTLRKNDLPYSTGAVDTTGTFYSTDGSRIRFDADPQVVGNGTIYTPDGTRYILGSSTASIIDRNGNTINYDKTTREWTDTFGRVIKNPLPENPQPGIQPYTLPGLAGVSPDNVIKYYLVWANLQDALTPDENNQTPSLRVVGSEYLPIPGSLPNDTNNIPQDQSTQYERLFQSVLKEDNPNDPNNYRVATQVVGRGQTGNQVFNPVVLKEIQLPDGTSYKFSYNVYGEIDKIIYPTLAYDKYAYTGPAATPTQWDQEGDDQPYVQSLRTLTSKKQSVEGTGNDLSETTYDIARSLDGGGGGTTIFADGMMVVEWKYSAGDKAGYDAQRDFHYYPFGDKDPRAGLVAQKFYYSAPVNGVRALMRRELYQYDAHDSYSTEYTVNCQNGQSPAHTSFAMRRATRTSRVTSIIFEGSGPALAQSTTFGYNVSDEMMTGVEQTLAESYDYVVLDNNTAQTAAIAQIPLGNKLTSNEKTYLSNSAYTSRHIVNLQNSLTVKDGQGNVLSQSQIVYDEPGYGLIDPGSPAYWQAPGTSYRANPTTMRTWVKESNSWLETHAQFDKFGNLRKQWDASGDVSKFVETVYEDTTSNPYKFAFPSKVISPVSDPTGVHGSSTSSQTTRTYDPVTGLLLSATDANGQTSTLEYDYLLRPKKSTAPQGGGTIETEYSTTPGNLYIKVKTQLDDQKWAEKTSYFDGAGRVYKNKVKDSQGDVYSEVQFENYGRLKRVSNAYRSGDQVLWSKPRYDSCGRVAENFGPAPDGQTGDSLGIAEYGISTVSGFVGTYISSTDASGRKARSLLNSLGKVIRADEPTGNNDLGALDNPNQPTFYSYNAAGQMVKIQQGIPNQGVQYRYFMYDSLGRLSRIRLPEQNINSNLNTTGNPDNNQWSVGYTYDALGNVTTLRDAKNMVIANSYDKANRLITKTYSDGTPQIDYYYDGAGLGSIPQWSRGTLSKVTNGVSETRYTGFDRLGRMLSSQQVTDGQAYNFAYKYNLSGSLIEETFPSGRVVRSDLDADGGLQQVSSKTSTGSYVSYASNFSYAATGAIKSMMLGNGEWESTQFNIRNQVTQIGLGPTATDTGLWKVNYDYGELNSDGSVDGIKNIGNIAKQTTTIGRSIFIQTYKYDELNRLTEAKENNRTVTGTQNWKQNFSYDKFGNRTGFSQIVGSTQLVLDSVTSPSVDPNTNRFASGQGYSYDNNGNLTQDAENRGFTFNGDDRQTEVRDLTISAPPGNPDANVVGRYYYDGVGARVKKVTASEITVFVYDGNGQLAAEYSNQVNNQPVVSYVTTDNLGSPRVVTDKMGTVLSRRDFMPFGEELGAGVGARSTDLKFSASGSDNIRQRFTGYQKDQETQLDFAEARMYSNKHGRFTAVDPLYESAVQSNPQTFNRYTYTGNNPVNLTDPSGLIWLKNDQTNEIKWVDDTVYDPIKHKGWTDVTGQLIQVFTSPAGSDLAQGGARAGDLVILNSNHTISVIGNLSNLSSAQLAMVARYASSAIAGTQNETNSASSDSAIAHKILEFITGIMQGVVFGVVHGASPASAPSPNDTIIQRIGQMLGSAGVVIAGFLTFEAGKDGAALCVATGQLEGVPFAIAVSAGGIVVSVSGSIAVIQEMAVPVQMSGDGGGSSEGGGGGRGSGAGENAGGSQANSKPPGYDNKTWVKQKGNQGYKDPDGNVWKKDQLHKDHWDVSDRKGDKVREVDFNGNQIWPGGPKNKNKTP